MEQRTTTSLPIITPVHSRAKTPPILVCSVPVRPSCWPSCLARASTIYLEATVSAAAQGDGIINSYEPPEILQTTPISVGSVSSPITESVGGSSATLAALVNYGTISGDLSATAAPIVAPYGTSAIAGFNGEWDDEAHSHLVDTGAGNSSRAPIHVDYHRIYFLFDRESDRRKCKDRQFLRLSRVEPEL